MVKAGTIIKIQVQNFVTYSYIEMYPGPNLNMIIGPNGTGKSTIVAAIILGLGGNPKLVGRGTKISDYIKHQQNEAKINIVLQGNEANNFVKITRIIEKDNKSKYMIDNQKINEKEVLNIIKEFNIQVDNLCQFLPQERVQDFAKLNQQDLLKETIKALCKYDLIEKQEKLILIQEDFNKLKNNNEKFKEKLNLAQESNARLETKVRNFKKKKEYLSDIENVERKICWVQFDTIHDKVSNLKEKLIELKKTNDKLKDECKTYENKIESERININKSQELNSSIIKSMRSIENIIKKTLDDFNDYKNIINFGKDEMNCALKKLNETNKEIKVMETKISELNIEKDLKNKIINDMNNEKLDLEFLDCTNNLRNLSNQKDIILERKNSQQANLKTLQYEINALENVASQKLYILKSLSEDSYQAVLWLRSNKHLFKKKIFEPIILEVNVLNSLDAVYLENVIAVRDRIAFTCTDKNDMKMFVKLLREDMGLTVNVFYSSDENISQYKPIYPIEQLKKYGLNKYLTSLFTAPPQILTFLCKTYKIHNIPIGNANTNECFQNIPNEIRVFFSDCKRFSVGFSKYSKEKSIKQNPIKSDKNFSKSLDVIAIDKLKQKIIDVEKTIELIDNEAKEIFCQINLKNNQIKKISEENKKCNDIKQEIKIIEDRIISMKKRVNEMKKNTKSVDEIRDDFFKKFNNSIKKIIEKQMELKINQNKLGKILINYHSKNLLLEKYRYKLVVLKNKYDEIKQLYEENKINLNNFDEMYKNLKLKAKKLLEEGKNRSKGFTPNDDGFNEFNKAFKELPSNLEKLEMLKQEILSKIDCLNSADNDEIKEYENCEKEIKQLKNSINDSEKEISNKCIILENLYNEWINPLKYLIEEINNNFSLAFKRIGCAGEIILNIGNNEKDYKNYGICIKVTYRDGEPLQELNNVIQSGGERAVATAAYMLSLQELTPVPFRCVDEINQGMDANNERRIFEMIVDSTTSQLSTSQYFLITPKLIPNLKFVDRMKIHVIHNGFFVKQDTKWFASKLCNPDKITV